MVYSDSHDDNNYDGCGTKKTLVRLSSGDEKLKINVEDGQQSF